MKQQQIRASDFAVPPGASPTQILDTLRRAAETAFGGDRDKIALWSHSSNPRLGGASPSEFAVCSAGLASAIATLQPAKRARRRNGGLL